MVKRNSPYTHSDGSNCWTKNCSRNTETVEPTTSLKNTANKETFMQEWFKKPNNEDAPTVDLIAPLSEFEAAAKRGELQKQTHPIYPFTTYKYSADTTWLKNWNDITLASRGLIVNHETGEIVARPFSKFFNHNEPSAPVELLRGPMVVSEKLDGSLGIGFETPDGYQITTAGGFSGEQAAHATALYRENYEGKWERRKNLTYMWEIIYPSNRIVVDYGNEDDIYLIGAVNKFTGKSVPLSELTEWKWKRAVEYDNFDDLNEVLTSGERSNAEGYVVHYTETDTRVKFKHEEYISHHRFATGVNSRRVWEMLRDGADMDELKKTAPEELEHYIDNTKAKILKDFRKVEKSYEDTYANFMKTVPENISQKEFAEKVKKEVPAKFIGYVFTKRAGYEVNEMFLRGLWEQVKPPFVKGFFGMNGLKEEAHRIGEEENN